jgi:hypothetical protein
VSQARSLARVLHDPLSPLAERSADGRADPALQAQAEEAIRRRVRPPGRVGAASELRSPVGRIPAMCMV